MTYQGLLPDTHDGLTAPFWAATDEGRLTAQQCSTCGVFRWPPSELCPECLSTAAAWTKLAGTAEVWSYAVYHRSMHPAFVAVPYTVAMLELPEGIRMYGAVVTSTGDADADGEVKLGDQVHATFERIEDGVVLVRWVPTEGASAPAAVQLEAQA